MQRLTDSKRQARNHPFAVWFAVEYRILRVADRKEHRCFAGNFSPEELRDLLDEMENGDEPLPATVAQFKKRYFEFYDDVKDKSLKKQDW